MSERINQALVKLFKKHRIVFWYDEEESLRGDFDTISLPDVEKVEIVNNEFGLKYRLLREQPMQKFLVFKSGAQPADRDNWLLDIQLAHTDFRTDKASLWLTELELPYEFRPIVNCHEFFFNSAKRRDQLKDRVTKTDTTTQICTKMLSVCADSDSRLDSVLENLLEELATDSTAKRYDLITKCGLDPFLWEQVKKAYQYESNAPSVKDFAIELFKSCYQMELGGTGKLGNEALVFLKRWKDSRTHEKTFETLSDRFSEVLGIHNDLERRELKQLAASSVWSQLPSDKQAAILAEVGLREPDAVDVSTDATIAAALAERPIDSRRNAALAVPTLAGQALRKAAATVEPTARSIAIEKTTLRTGDDVREWAKRAESQLLEEVKKGPVLVS